MKVHNLPKKAITIISRTQYIYTLPTELTRHNCKMPIKGHKYRVIFKLAILTFKTLQSHQLSYLYDLIASTDTPARSLRSSTQHRLSVNASRTVTSSRSFRHSSVTVGNKLPQNIRDSNSLVTFRHKHKTQLCPAILAI
jgi:hypothetical protein